MVMPTTTYLYRKYCKTCKDFILHETNPLDSNDQLFCCECGTQKESIYYSEIDEDKILKQRERYKSKRKLEAEEFINSSLLGLGTLNQFNDMFGEVKSKNKTIIIEDDCGLEKIEKLEREKKREEREKRIEEAKKYHSLGRNDICLCGSNKKYKKCCLDKYDYYKNWGL